MLVPRFVPTVSALVYSLLRETAAPQWVKAEPSPNLAVNFVLNQYRRMPDYLRPPMRLLTLAFSAWPLLRHRVPFQHLPHELRWRQIQAWKFSRLGPQRDFIRFYESLAVFASASLRYEQEPPGELPAASASELPPDLV